MFSAYRMISPRRYRERFGLDFEDFAVGQRFRHRPGITFSQQENVSESLDTFNGAMLHYDAHYAAQTGWGKPLMVSTLTLQRAIGMTSKTFGRRKAIPRFDEILMTGPVFGGDTLYSESEVLSVAEGDADAGLVMVKTRVVKPDGAEIARMTWRAAIFRRGRGPMAGEGEPVTDARFAAYHEGADGFLVEQAGMFFDDFAAGDGFIHYPHRRFSTVDTDRYARQALELSPHAYGMADAEGGTVAETFLIGAATALTTRTFGRVVANLGWFDVEAPRPVRDGDTVEAESEVTDARASRSREGEGILAVNTRLYNQRRELVLSFGRKLLVYRRSEQKRYAAAGY